MKSDFKGELGQPLEAKPQHALVARVPALAAAVRAAALQLAWLGLGLGLGFGLGFEFGFGFVIGFGLRLEAAGQLAQHAEGRDAHDDGEGDPELAPVQHDGASGLVGVRAKTLTLFHPTLLTLTLTLTLRPSSMMEHAAWLGLGLGFRLGLRVRSRVRIEAAAWLGGGSQRTRHSESWGPQYLSRERSGCGSGSGLGSGLESGLESG